MLIFIQNQTTFISASCFSFNLLPTLLWHIPTRIFEYKKWSLNFAAEISVTRWPHDKELFCFFWLQFFLNWVVNLSKKRLLCSKQLWVPNLRMTSNSQNVMKNKINYHLIKESRKSIADRQEKLRKWRLST